MSHKEISIEAIEELQKPIESRKPVWYFSNVWIRCDRFENFSGAYMANSTFLTVSLNEPQWSPELLTLQQAIKIETSHQNKCVKIWELESFNNFWTNPGKPSYSPESMYLVQATMPIFDPMQQKIRQLMLHKNKANKTAKV